MYISPVSINITWKKIERWKQSHHDMQFINPIQLSGKIAPIRSPCWKSGRGAKLLRPWPVNGGGTLGTKFGLKGGFNRISYVFLPFERPFLEEKFCADC